MGFKFIIVINYNDNKNQSNIEIKNIIIYVLNQGWGMCGFIITIRNY